MVSEHKNTGRKILFFIALLLLVAFSSRSAIQRLLTPTRPWVQHFIEKFAQDLPAARERGAKLDGDWTIRDRGLWLPPKGQGSLHYVFEKGKQEWLRLTLTVKRPKPGSLNVQVMSYRQVGEGVVERVRHFVWNDKSLWEKDVWLKSKAKGKLSLIIEAHNQGAKPHLIVPVITLSRFGPRAQTWFPWRYLPALVLVPFLFYFFLGDSLTSRIICAGLALAILSISTFVPTFPRLLFYLYFAFLFLWWALKRISVARNQAWFVFFLLCGILMVGWSLRWLPLVERINHVMDPDAQELFTIARTMSHPYDSELATAPWVREPLLPALLRVWFGAAPANNNSQRLLSFILSLVSLLVIYLLGKRCFNEVVGLGGALLAAYSPGFIFMSNRGLRFELYLIGCALLLFLLFSKPRYKAVWVGMTAGLSSLVRLSVVGIFVPLIIIWALKERWKLRQWLWCLGLWAALIFPHLLYNYVKMPIKDPFFSVNVHARFFLNREFQGQPGFPTPEEVSKDPWTGEHISLLSYYFKFHSVTELGRYAFKGIKRLYFTTFVYEQGLGRTWWLYALYLLGGLLLLVKRRWDVLIILVLMGLPVWILAGIGCDWRLVSQLSPFYFYLPLFGFDTFRQFFWGNKSA